MIPGLEDWVMNTVEDVVTDTLVNPGTWFTFVEFSRCYIHGIVIFSPLWAFEGQSDSLSHNNPGYFSNKIQKCADPWSISGRFYIDLSDGNVKPFLIKGVRKLKRTVLHLKIEVANQKKDRDSDKKKKIVFSLNTGAIPGSWYWTKTVNVLIKSVYFW